MSHVAMLGEAAFPTPLVSQRQGVTGAISLIHLEYSQVPPPTPPGWGQGMGRALKSQVLKRDHLGPVALSGLQLICCLCPWPWVSGSRGQGGEGAEHLAAFLTSGPGPCPDDSWLPRFPVV